MRGARQLSSCRRPPRGTETVTVSVRSPIRGSVLPVVAATIGRWGWMV